MYTYVQIIRKKIYKHTFWKIIQIPIDVNMLSFIF